METDELTPQAAAREGLPVSACPYRPGSPEGLAWAREWTQATGTRRLIANEFGALAEDKAAVGVSAEPTRHGRGGWDNVHELWSGPPAGGQIVAHVRLVRDAVPALTAAMQQMAESAVATFKTLAEFGDQFLTLLDAEDHRLPKDPKARALARKRRPFTCHRHGTQPGGFCRTCSRGR